MAKPSSVHELVINEEKRLAKKDHGKQAIKQEGLKLPLILLGAVIYSFSLNIFLRPLHLYSGGLMGFAQLFESLFNRAGITFGGIQFSGILYYLMNVPAIILAFKKMRRRFIIKTVFAISSISIMLSLIPIPAAPILNDMITTVILAGVLCGIGVGIILYEGACDGGMTLIGMLIVAIRGKSSIGQISIMTNLVLYGIMLFLFDIPTTIYSFIFSLFSSIATDRIHAQNINSQVMIITKLEDIRPMEVEIMSRLNRGMTEIKGKGTFTGEDVRVFVVYVSKYETSRLRAIIQSHDPRAFIAETSGVRIDGPFMKHLQ
jgi:uncharacterized membrane-anchored protein YitT (DUF2179 family)